MMKTTSIFNYFIILTISMSLNLVASFNAEAIDFLKVFNLPIGKSKCPSFTFKAKATWSLNSGRKKGDRWILHDDKNKTEIGYFAYALPNTDQKMLPEVFEGTVKLGGFDVSKYSVTLEVMGERTFEEMKKVKSGLVTSYHFPGKLDKLYFMSAPYDMSSGREKEIEALLSTIKVL